jgi:hypothetical protein
MSTSRPIIVSPDAAGGGSDTANAVDTVDAVDEELHRWMIELNHFERLLSIQEQLIDEGGDIDETRTAQALFRPPTGLPPLPEPLVPWATRLAERNEALLRRARAALAAQTPVVARPAARAVVAPVGLDTFA